MADPIYVKLNENYGTEKGKRLQKCEKNLCKKYPNFNKISQERKLQAIVDGVFQEGFQKKIYIRNLTFTDEKSGEDRYLLGIRVERTPEDYLDSYLPKGVSLLFKGHLKAKMFFVDCVYEIGDTEKLDFEEEHIVIPRKTMYSWEGLRERSLLYDVLHTTTSLTKHTQENLEQWKAYLHWKKELAGCQIYGCKYYKVTFDEQKKRLVFWLICETKEEFQNFKKYLSRDMEVFPNSYSNDKWHFKFSVDGNHRGQSSNSVEIGKYRGVVEEYYFKEREYIDTNNASKQATVEKTKRIFDEFFDEFDDDIEDYEEEQKKRIEEEIVEVFKNPYVVKVAYELSKSDLEEINQKNLDEEKIKKYVYDNVIGEYFPNGFLALSAVGEFVLISRFEKAIDQLERDECYTPNLSMWLFDVKKARICREYNQITIDTWLNEKIEENENQKLAVYKMLTAPDLCLIQGPPGTGKTTVIAEAIYQFVKNGNRVLLASQSNDAVDNALERLVETPEIRAIRLGQKGKRKRKKEELSINKFSEDEVLRYYYNALSTKISQTWLNQWDNLDNAQEEYSLEIRDAKQFYEDIAEINDVISKNMKQSEELQETYNKLKKEIEQANEYNETILLDSQQYKLLESNVQNSSNELEQFSLSEDMLKILEQECNPLIETTRQMGIEMLPCILDFKTMGSNKENFFILLAIRNLNIVKNLKAKLKEVEGENTQAESNLILLQNKRDEVKQKMFLCIEAGDEEGENNYKKEFLMLKKQIDTLSCQSSIVEFSEVEKNILSKSVIEMIHNREIEKAMVLLDSVVCNWQSAFEKALAHIKNEWKEQTEVDITEIRKKYQETIGKRDILKEEIKKNEKIREHKKQKLAELRKRYGLESVEEIVEYIEELKKENIEKLQEQKEFRNDWEKTLQDFQKRLEDENMLKYDQRYYKKTYINACNVVGISCTDNMKNLTDNGYDDFDVVIIDEVSKATPPELLIPLMKARKAILVGDHRQLPPMFKEYESSYKELIQNKEDMPEELKNLLTEENFKRFKNMVTASLFKDYFEKADDSIKHSLLVQYRMHSDIMNIINRFYEQKLENGLSTEVEKMEKNHGLTISGVDGSSFIVPEKHAYWIDSSYLPSGERIEESFINNSTSACNILEKHIVIELLKKIAVAYKEQGYSEQNPKTVGVISFYQMQVNELREAFRTAKKEFDFSALEVDINTVDRFQGKEKNIIITSLVRSNKQQRVSKHVATFERINVAFSRAQELLLIVGSKNMYEKAEVELPNMDTVGTRTVCVYQNIIDDLHRKACFGTSNKVITSEKESEILAEYNKRGGKKWN